MIELLDGFYYCKNSITIIDRLGKDNLVTDFLSRLIHIGDNSLLDENFPHEILFYIYIKYKLFITNFFNIICLQLTSPHNSHQTIISQLYTLVQNTQTSEYCNTYFHKKLQQKDSQKKHSTKDPYKSPRLLEQIQEHIRTLMALFTKIVSNYPRFLFESLF